MKTVSFNEFKEDMIVLVALDTCPPHMIMDYRTRNENLKKKRELCHRCDGTGNQLFSMHQVCEDCWGAGYKRGDK